MEEQKNPQELQEETVQTLVTEEEVPAAEVQEEKPAEEAAAEQTVEEPTAEPAKKATPGKIAVAVGIVVLLASLLIALVVSGQNKKEEAPVQEETVAEETVEATIPADGNPEDVTCKGSYSISDEEVAATADTVVATIGENTLTNRNLQIYYWMEVQNFLNTYGNYAAYFGMDYTQPLDTQRSTYDENLTWQQFFLDTALTNWHQVQAMKLMAEEAGLQPSAEDQAYLEGLDAYLEQTAAGFGISVEELMAANFGPGADKEGYRYFQDLYLKGLPYYEAESAKMVPTEAELEAYFAEHEEDYAASGVTRDSKFVNVRHILVKLEDGVADENGTVTYSDEEWKACETEAKAILDQWLAGDKSEESFAALATEKTDDGGSMATGGLYEQVYEGQMVPEFNDWCFDESRQHGDYGLVKHSGNNYSGYHVMFFVGSQPQWISYAESDWMNEQSKKLLENIVAEYPMEVAYENIALGVVKLG